MDGERAEPSRSVLVMCKPHVSLYMQQPDAMIHVASFRPMADFASIQLALFVEGPVVSGSHLVGVLDRSHLDFSVELFDGSSQSPWTCALKVPGAPFLRVIELAFLYCNPPQKAAPISPGNWKLKFRWLKGPAMKREYTIPFEVCSEQKFDMIRCTPDETGESGAVGRPQGDLSWQLADSRQQLNPRIGVCVSSISNQRSTLFLGHIIPFIEYYRLSGVHHMVLHLRPDVFIDFSPKLRLLYSSDSPGFILEVIDAGYVTRDPFVVTKFPYYDQGEAHVAKRQSADCLRRGNCFLSCIFAFSFRCPLSQSLF